MSKRIITLILICLMAVSVASCSKAETIDGTWSMIRQEHADGTVYEGGNLPVHEYYVIDGDKAKYICRMPDSEKDISFSLSVKELSKNEYEFRISDRLSFHTGKLEGKQLKFDMGDGQVFIFEKTDKVPERPASEQGTTEKQIETPDCAEETVTPSSETATTPSKESELKLLKEVSRIDVSSLPEGYNYSFDEAGQIAKVVDYFNDLHLISDFPEKPDEYGGMTWVIELTAKDGKKQRVYLFGNMFIRTEDEPWYKLSYEEAASFEKVLGKE